MTRIVLIVLVVLGGLAVAADRITVSMAQDKAAQRAQTTLGLAQKPSVDITGFPFLTQALSGRLDDVKIGADDIAASAGGRSVRIDSFRADLYGVRLSNGFTRAVADSADGRLFLTYADLSKAAPYKVVVSYAPPAADGTPRVTLTGTFRGAHLSVLSEVRPTRDAITLHAQRLPEAFTALGLESTVRNQIDLTFEVRHLPGNLGLTKVTTSPDGMTAEVAGTQVVLAG